MYDLDEKIAFFMMAFDIDPAHIEALGKAITQHTDSRGNTDDEAVLAICEQLAAPVVDITEQAAAVRQRRFVDPDDAHDSDVARNTETKCVLRKATKGGYVAQIVIPPPCRC